MYFIIRIFQAFTWMVSFPSQIHLFGIRGNFKHIFHHNLHTYNRTVLILCYFPLPTITESPNFASDERTPAPLDSHAPKSCHSHIRHCCRYIHISTVWVRYRKTANSIIQMCLCEYNWNYCSWAKKKGDTMDEITPIAIPASLAFWALRIYSTFYSRVNPRWFRLTWWAMRWVDGFIVHANGLILLYCTTHRCPSIMRTKSRLVIRRVYNARICC